MTIRELLDDPKCILDIEVSHLLIGIFLIIMGTLLLLLMIIMLIDMSQTFLC